MLGKHFVEAVFITFFLIVGTNIPVGSLRPSDDTTPPTTLIHIEGLLGDNNWYITDVEITLNASDNESGVNATYYKLDGDQDWSVYTCAFNLTTDDYHNIHYYSVDNAGNVEPSHHQSINRDTTPPYTWLTISHDIVRFWKIDNTSDVNYTMISIDAGEWMQYTVPITITTCENHTFSYYSVDRAGNREETKTTTVQGHPDIEFTLKGCLGLKITIRNSGETNLTDIPWSISPDIFLGEASGYVDIPAGEVRTIQRLPVYLGRATLQVTVGGLTKNASCLVYFLFIFGIGHPP